MNRDLIPLEEPNAIIRTERLTAIENRLHDNVNRMCEGMIDIGRCLNQAKDEKLVPHGQWQAWVQQHTGLSIRAAQQAMKAARELPNTNTFSHLEFSKVYALLSLPAAEREEFAEKVDAENMSVREIEEAIKAKKAAEHAAEEERNKRIELENALRIRDDQTATERKRLLAEVDSLKVELEAAQAGGAAQAEIERLQAEIEEQEEELIRRANAEARAKKDLLDLRAQIARGDASRSDGGENMTPEELGEIVKAFIGRAAVFPHMRTYLATCDHNTRGAYRAYVEMLAGWCERATRALDTVTGEVIEV